MLPLQNSKVCTFNLATKVVQWIWLIIQNLGFQVSDAPTSNFKESKSTIDIIKSNHLTSQVIYIAVPIHYVHDEYSLLIIDLIEFKNTIQT